MALGNNPTPNELVKEVKNLDTSKQATLVSGTNIKTINNESILGSGNITISGGSGSATDVQVDSTSITSQGVANLKTKNGNYNASTNKLVTESDLTGFATKSGNNTFSGTNNFTGIFQIGGNSLLDMFYPVGTIVYGDANSTSPASRWGGTWEQLPANYAIWTASSGAYNVVNGAITGTIAAGLPNIKGSITIPHIRKSGTAYTGAFVATAGTNQNFGTNSSGGAIYTYDIDAHRSNSIYADGNTTVQPPAIKVYAWRRTA